MNNRLDTIAARDRREQRIGLVFALFIAVVAATTVISIAQALGTNQP